MLRKALILGAVIAVYVVAPGTAVAKHAGGGDDGDGNDGATHGAVYTATNGPAGNQLIASSCGWQPVCVVARILAVPGAVALSRGT